MASLFNFSDGLRRELTEAALKLSEYSSKVLAAPFTEARDFPGDKLAGIIPYRIGLPVVEEGSFRTYGVEGGNPVNRLGDVTRQGTIQEFPCQFFVTMAEIDLHAQRKINLKRRVLSQMGDLVKRYRLRQFFDGLKLAVDENEADDNELDLPSMRIAGGTGSLSFEMVYQAKRKFVEDRREQIIGLLVHSDVFEFLEPEAKRQASAMYSGKRWITADEAGNVRILGVPVTECPWDDKIVQKDYEDYTLSGLRRLTDPDEAYDGTTNPYLYRTFLVTKLVMKEYTGWATGSDMVMDTAPVPAGTAGYPANGQSAGKTWYTSLYTGNIIEVPRDGWDRIGLVEIDHGPGLELDDD